jgi:23S rRNA (pseudouridine1915-N3)-methyltransferase
MKIRFCLDWGKSPRFKSKETSALFSEYVARIKHFESIAVSGFDKKEEKAPGSVLWICHRESRSKLLSSEDLSREIAKLQNRGTRTLQIIIGGPDGFTDADLAALKPDLLWSFGPMTLPHELATIVASEQLYRAYTILHKLPYHSGH